MTHSPARLRALLPATALLCPVLGLAWAFAYTLVDLYRTWGTNPQYSHGYLVPVFALFLLWTRRQGLDRAALRASWLGLPVLAVGSCGLLYGGYYSYTWLEQI